jgi:imidazolonepropionase
VAAGLLIRGARQLLTLRGPRGPRRGPALLDLGLIPDGAVLIRNGLIHAAGPSRQVEALAVARGCEEMDATGRVVMPAFIDLETSLVHAHPSPRNFERLLKHHDNPDPEVFRDVVDEGGRALAGLSAQSLRRRAEQTVRGMMRHGTTTVESRAGYRLDESGALKVLRVQMANRESPLRIRSSVRLSLPPGEDAATWTEWACEQFLPKVSRRKLASFVDLEFNRQRLPAPLAGTLLRASTRLGFGIKVHGDFFGSSSAAPLAGDAGALSIGNLRCITGDEINQLASTNTIAVLKPGGALQIGRSGAAPAREMIDAGVAPGLASGYHAELSPGYNMQLILLLASRLYRLRPEEAIHAATINNAFALGLQSSRGSLESGKRADLLVLKVSDFHEVGHYAGVNIVDKVFRRGRVVYP